MVLMRLCVYRFAETLSRVSFQRRGSSVLPGEGAGIADPPVLENPAGEGGGGGRLQLDSKGGGLAGVSCRHGALCQGPRPI